MSFNAVLMGCNAIAYSKDGHRFAMTCAWTTMIDYDKLLLLIGSQSVTGNSLSCGQIIGISALASDQKAIALTLGDKHSDKLDKLEGIPFHDDEGAILISGAKTAMKCKILEIRKYGKSQDNMVIAEIVAHHADSKKSFLDLEKVF
jgi:flavin reductase (DIM6/NTAB) family NADH-FMN oxidoreductase RutF